MLLLFLGFPGKLRLRGDEEKGLKAVPYAL